MSQESYSANICINNTQNIIDHSAEVLINKLSQLSNEGVQAALLYFVDSLNEFNLFVYNDAVRLNEISIEFIAKRKTLVLQHQDVLESILLSSTIQWATSITYTEVMRYIQQIAESTVQLFNDSLDGLYSSVADVGTEDEYKSFLENNIWLVYLMALQSSSLTSQVKELYSTK